MLTMSFSSWPCLLKEHRGLLSGSRLNGSARAADLLLVAREMKRPGSGTPPQTLPDWDHSEDYDGYHCYHYH